MGVFRLVKTFAVDSHGKRSVYGMGKGPHKPAVPLSASARKGKSEKRNDNK